MKLRIISRDTGGGFGIRSKMYPETVMVAFAARKLARPVKWQGDRSETFDEDGWYATGDLCSFREGHLSPVFFGSALRNFGVRDLIDALAAFAPRVPYVVALIDLQEGPRLMSRVEGIAAADVRIGMAVRAKVVHQDEQPLLVFEPVEA